jgi:hypothetical protein
MSSAAETVLHQAFCRIVAEYHPFCEYIGYSECDGGFVVGYRGSNGDKYLLLNTDLQVVEDQSFGFTRSAGVAAIALGVLGALFGVDSQQRY